MPDDYFIIKGWSKYFRLWKHKGIELEFSKAEAWFELSFTVDPHQDHGGAKFVFALAYWEFEVAFIDDRHWNYEARRWYTYPEDEGWPEGGEPENIAYEMEKRRKQGNV